MTGKTTERSEALRYATERLRKGNEKLSVFLGATGDYSERRLRELVNRMKARNDEWEAHAVTHRKLDGRSG